jgi:hypothetical protein
VRAFCPLGDDRALLGLIRRGEFTLNGFRNRDLQGFFFRAAARDQREIRRRSAWVGRKLRLLRAHGLIRKIAGTYRYQLTETGQKAISSHTCRAPLNRSRTNAEGRMKFIARSKQTTD